MKPMIQEEIIDDSRAAFLLGLPLEQLRQICEMSGLGHMNPDKTDGHLTFTYEEMHRLCRLIAGPAS
jgi:hypothetical protein